MIPLVEALLLEVLLNWFFIQVESGSISGAPQSVIARAGKLDCFQVDSLKLCSYADW